MLKNVLNLHCQVCEQQQDRH